MKTLVATLLSLSKLLVLILILFNFQLFAACPPSYNLTCGELITNGGFNYFSQVPWDNASPFDPLNDHICDWEIGSRSPQVKGTNGEYYVYAQTENSSLGGLIIESVLKPIQLANDRSYILTFKLRKNGSTPFPHRFKIKTLNQASITSKIWQSPSDILIELTSTQLNLNTTGDWATYTYCLTPALNTDRMLFYPQVGSSTANNLVQAIHLDDISIKELSVDAGPTLDACVQTRFIGPDPNCIIPGATYSWSSPAGITGLANPNSARTEVDVTATNIFYTLTMTIPGSTCSTSDIVLVSGHYKGNAIPDGEDVDWITTNNLGIGTNPVIVNHKDFYVEGEFIVDQNIKFEDCNFYFAGNSKITIDNARLEFDNIDNQLNYLTSCAPNVFWDGIYVDANNGGGLNFYGEDSQNNERKIEISNSTNGLILKNSPGTLIKNVLFDRNKTAIKLENIGITQSLTEIIGCEFKSSSPILSELGSPYYPTYSIEALNFIPGFGAPDLIDIKHNNSGTAFLKTVFDATGGGIFLNNSGAAISVAEFNNFQNLLFNQTLPLTSVNPIKIYGTNNNVNNPDINITGVTFNDCKQAIFSDGSVELEINGCLFNANGSLRPTANFATVSDNYESFTIRNCTINDAGSGIAIYNSPEVYIGYNIIDLQVQSGGFYTDKSNDRSVGITVMNFFINDPDNPQNYVAQNVIIEDNEIKHSKIGISAEFTEAEIKNNRIYDLNDRYVQAPSCYPLPSPCNPLPAYGIRTIGANFGYNIELNTIKLDLSQYQTSDPSTDAKVNAISIEHTISAANTASVIKCNQVEGTGIGLKFSGSNSPSTIVEKNTMKDHYYGFVLAKAGFIGDVGSSGAAGDNEWNGSYGGSETFADSSDGSSCTLYVRNATTSSFGNFNPSIDPNDDQRVGVALQKSIVGINNTSQVTCIAPSLRLKGSADSLFATRLKIKDTTGFARKLAKGKMSYMIHAADSAVRLNQQLLYWQIKHDSVLNADTSWQSFKDSMNNTALGKSMGKNSRAVSINSTNNFDVNVNIITAIGSKLDSQLIISSKDTNELARIATLCPYYDGIAVYHARTILMQMGYPPIVNTCEITSKPARASRRLKSLTDEEITLYPNPTQGSLTVNLNIKEGQIVFFELYDVLGKKQDEIKLKEGNIHQLNLKQLQHGIYFYRLMNDSSILKSGKLIIQ